LISCQRIWCVASGNNVARREEGGRPGPRVQPVRGYRLVVAGLQQRHRGHLLHGKAPRGGPPRLCLQQLGALGPRALGTLPDHRARQVPGQSSLSSLVPLYRSVTMCQNPSGRIAFLTVPRCLHASVAGARTLGHIERCIPDMKAASRLSIS
jgi:hypothetical protein